MNDIFASKNNKPPLKRPVMASGFKKHGTPYVPISLREEELKSASNADDINQHDALEMQVARYGVLGDRLLKIVDTAQAERRNLGVIRSTSFFLTLGIPAGLATVFSKAVSEPSALNTLFIETTIAGAFIFFIGLGRKLNNIFEEEMAAQTKTADKAEQILREMEEIGLTEVRKNHPEEISYLTLRRSARDEIKAEGINRDFPTKAINATFYAASILIALNLAIKILPIAPEINREYKSLIEGAIQEHKPSNRLPPPIFP